jgi:hypothetical protein
VTLENNARPGKHRQNEEECSKGLIGEAISARCGTLYKDTVGGNFPSENIALNIKDNRIICYFLLPSSTVICKNKNGYP